MLYLKEAIAVPQS